MIFLSVTRIMKFNISIILRYIFIAEIVKCDYRYFHIVFHDIHSFIEKQELYQKECKYKSKYSTKSNHG